MCKLQFLLSADPLVSYMFNRYQVLLQWKKNNPNATYEDLAKVFQEAEREDLADITRRVADSEMKMGQDPEKRIAVYSLCRSKFLVSLMILAFTCTGYKMYMYVLQSVWEGGKSPYVMLLIVL